MPLGSKEIDLRRFTLFVNRNLFLINLSLMVYICLYYLTKFKKFKKEVTIQMDKDSN